MLDLFWESVDRAPIALKAWALSYIPEPLVPLAAILITIFTIIGVFCGLFAVLTLVERKGLGRMQNRLGPNRVGPFGIFQPAADGIKMLIKEDIVPARADGFIHFLAPIILVVGSLLAFSVIPYGRGMVPVELEAALIFFFAGGAASELSIFMAGWSSHNKYSLLGAMRALAQLLSYELPLILSVVPVVMLVGTLSTVKIVEAQDGYWMSILPNWHVFTPWGFVGWVLFTIASFAETNRSPFDLPEAESELIAGHLTEYSGFKYALFFMAEYLAMIAISGMGVTLFLGGWQAPAPWLEWVPSWCWFFAKIMVVLWLFIWVRATVPRLRIDQLMAFAWKFMLPLALINIFVAAFWIKLLPIEGILADATRWIVCLLALAGAYVGLGTMLGGKHRAEKRTYHYAE